LFVSFHNIQQFLQQQRKEFYQLLGPVTLRPLLTEGLPFSPGTLSLDIVFLAATQALSVSVFVSLSNQK
jgi:hypothetical protein